jgi:hypothetical protein
MFLVLPIGCLVCGRLGIMVLLIAELGAGPLAP